MVHLKWCPQQKWPAERPSPSLPLSADLQLRLVVEYSRRMLLSQWNMWYMQDYLMPQPTSFEKSWVICLLFIYLFLMVYILFFSYTVVYWSVWYICFLQQSPQVWYCSTVSAQYQFSHVGDCSSCPHYFLLLLPIRWHEVIFKVSKHTVLKITCPQSVKPFQF